jgi:hypothetical protein
MLSCLNIIYVAKEFAKTDPETVVIERKPGLMPNALGSSSFK